MAKMFGGKESKAEEMSEAKAVKSGKVSPKQYAKAEKAEGEKGSMGSLSKRGSALKSGKMSAEKYATQKYAKGGYVRGADGVIKQGKTKGKII